MYRILTKPEFNLGHINSPGIERSYNLINEHYKYQLDIYRTYGFTVPSNHILMRLITTLEIYLGNDSDTYRMVEERIHDICSGLGITSDSTPGKMFTKAFYSKTCLLISTTFENYLEVDNWEDIRAVRCLTHQDTSLEVHTPYIGVMESSSWSKPIEGLAVVGIDIPLFSYQLKQWLIRNDIKVELERESWVEFISKYVIPGLLPEQIDIALRNRLQYIHNKQPVPKTLKERSFVDSYETSITNPLCKLLETVNTSRSHYKKALENIPFIFADNYLDAVPMEIAGLSMYSYWVVMLVFVDWVYPMTEILISDQRNVSDIRKILIRVERFTNSSSCLKFIPEILKTDFERKYNKIKLTYM